MYRAFDYGRNQGGEMGLTLSEEHVKNMCCGSMTQAVREGVIGLEVLPDNPDGEGGRTLYATYLMESGDVYRQMNHCPWCNRDQGGSVQLTLSKEHLDRMCCGTMVQAVRDSIVGLEVLPRQALKTHMMDSGYAYKQLNKCPWCGRGQLERHLGPTEPLPPDQPVAAKAPTPEPVTEQPPEPEKEELVIVDKELEIQDIQEEEDTSEEEPIVVDEGEVEMPETLTTAEAQGEPEVSEGMFKPKAAQTPKKRKGRKKKSG